MLEGIEIGGIVGSLMKSLEGGFNLGGIFGDIINWIKKLFQ